MSSTSWAASPNAKPPAQYGSGRWFDHYLRGADNGVEKEPAVAYYVMGDTRTPGAPGNEWRHADDWPVALLESRATLQEVHPMPVTGFLTALSANQLTSRVLPDDVLGRANHRFTPLG